MGLGENPRLECGSATPFPTVKDLISQLRSSFFATEFQRVEQTLVEREEHTRKKHDELENKIKSLEKEKDYLFLENLKLNDQLQKKQNESDRLTKENLEYSDQIKVLNHKVWETLELDDILKKKQREIDEVKKLNAEYERREAYFRVYKKHFLDLGDRVLNLEKTAKELMGSDGTPLINSDDMQPKNRDAESGKPTSFGKNGDSTKRTKSKSQEIIQIDDDDEDDDDDDDDDDDQKCISTLKRKRVSKEIKKERNDDNNPTGTQKRTNLQEFPTQPTASQPLSTPHSVESKPRLDKIQPKNLVSSLDSPDTSSDSDNENVDEMYKSFIARKKNQKERWSDESDMIQEIDKDDELCMNAVCALQRQIIQGKLKLYGDHRSRISQLTKTIVNGDPQQKVKKTASELNRSDVDDCRMFAKGYSSRLFKIYQDKEDPFFPPSRS